MSKLPENSTSDVPMSASKAIGMLLLIYVLIGGTALWKIRQGCLLFRDVCDAHDLLESVLSNRATLIGSIVMISVLVFITWQFIALARAGKLGVQQEDEERTLNVNGLLVALVVFGLYLGASMVILIAAANALDISDIETVDSFFWKGLFALKGSALVFVVLWHLNDSFVKPVSGFVLLVLGGVTSGSIYWLMKQTIWTM